MMLLLVMVTCLGPSLVTSFCLPDKPLAECLERQKPSTTPTIRTENELEIKLLTCLGVKKDSLAFVGTCTGFSSTCESKVFSSSLDCGSSSVCCQDNILDLRTQWPDGPSRDLNIIESKEDNYELLNQPGCGSSRVSFVLGGHVAPEGAFPFIVSFTQNISDSKQWKSFCGGVLISPDHVLSAAHCFQKVPEHLWENNVRVRLGVSNLMATKRQRDTFAKIENVTVHPKYTRQGDGYLNPFHDIAVIKLRLVRGKHKTVCLPTKVENRKKKLSAPGVVAGWGSTSSSFNTKPENLIYAHVNHVQRNACREKYVEFVKGVPGDVYITDNVICAGDREADACSGDSGSPLLWVDDQSRWSVAGIVSFGPSVCGQDVPGAYTRVESYLQWVKDIIA